MTHPRFYKVVLISFISLLFIPGSYAQTTNLQSKIDQRTADIQALQKEIQGYQKQLDTIGSQASSLASTIKSLDLTQKKLAADIKITENKIASKNLEIQELTGQISNKESTITDDQRIISYTFSTLDQLGSQSIPELILSSQSLGDTWNSLDHLESIQKNLFDKIDSLRATKTKL